MESPRDGPTLDIDSSHAPSSTSLSNIDAALSFYVIRYGHPRSWLRLLFCSLINIHFYDNESPDIDILPPTLRVLVLHNTSQSLNPFHNRTHPFLEILLFDGVAIDVAVTRNAIELPSLHLFIRGAQYPSIGFVAVTHVHSAT